VVVEGRFQTDELRFVGAPRADAVVTEEVVRACRCARDGLCGRYGHDANIDGTVGKEKGRDGGEGERRRGGEAERRRGGEASRRAGEQAKRQSGDQVGIVGEHRNAQTKTPAAVSVRKRRAGVHPNLTYSRDERFRMGSFLYRNSCASVAWLALFISDSPLNPRRDTGSPGRAVPGCGGSSAGVILRI
jgi:hypothetical protein